MRAVKGTEKLVAKRERQRRPLCPAFVLQREHLILCSRQSAELPGQRA